MPGRFPQEALDPHVRVQSRAVVAGVQGHLQREALDVRDQCLPDQGRARQPLRAQARLPRQGLHRGHDLMQRQGAVEAQRVGEGEAGPQPRLRDQSVGIKGHQAGLRPGQVGGDVEQDLALAQVFADAGKVQRLQGAQTPRRQAPQPTRRARREVFLFKEGDGQAAQSSVARDGRAQQPAPNDDDV